MNLENRLKHLRPRPAPVWNPDAQRRRADRREAWLPLAAAGLLLAIVIALATPSATKTPAGPQDDAATQRAPDPEPVTTPIVSWYRLDRLEAKEWKHVGYACERITPVGGRSWAFEYSYDLAFIFPVGDEKLTGGRFSVTAQLDAHGEAVTIDGFLALRDGPGRSLKLRTLDDERVLEMSSGDSVVKVRKTLDDPATPIPSLMLFSAVQTRNLADGTPLRHLDAWGLEPLVTVRATVSKPAKRPVLGREATVFDVELRDMSATLPELPAFTRFTLDRFGRIIHSEPADGSLRLDLVAREDDALLGDKMLKESGRRDPFARKPADPQITTRDVPLPPAPRVASVVDSLARAEMLLKALGDDVRANRGKAATERYAHLVALYRELWPRTRDASQAKLAKIRTDAETLFGGIQRVLERASALHSTIDTFVQALQIKEAEKRLAALTALEDAPELWRQEQRAQLTRLIASASAVLERGRIMVELTAKKLVLTGMVVSEDPRQTWALVNGTKVRVGDTIEGVRVESITRACVTVSLRGVARDLLLSK